MGFRASVAVCVVGLLACSADNPAYDLAARNDESGGSAGEGIGGDGAKPTTGGSTASDDGEAHDTGDEGSEDADADTSDGAVDEGGTVDPVERVRCRDVLWAADGENPRLLMVDLATQSVSDGPGTPEVVWALATTNEGELVAFPELGNPPAWILDPEAGGAVEQVGTIPTTQTVAGAVAHPSGELWLITDADMTPAELWTFQPGAEPLLVLTIEGVPYAGDQIVLDDGRLLHVGWDGSLVVLAIDADVGTYELVHEQPLPGLPPIGGVERTAEGIWAAGSEGTIYGLAENPDDTWDIEPVFDTDRVIYDLSAVWGTPDFCPHGEG